MLSSCIWLRRAISSWFWIYYILTILSLTQCYLYVYNQNLLMYWKGRCVKKSMLCRKEKKKEEEKYRTKSKGRNQEQRSMRKNVYTTKEIRESINEKIDEHFALKSKQIKKEHCVFTYLILTNLRHGTVFFWQLSIKGSTSSTMTKGASSKVTILKWLSSGSLSAKELYLGQTEYFRLSELFSHFPTWKAKIQKLLISDCLYLTNDISLNTRGYRYGKLE